MRCEHCGEDYDPRDGDHMRHGGTGHLPWLCRDALKATRRTLEVALVAGNRVSTVALVSGLSPATIFVNNATDGLGDEPEKGKK